MGQRAGDRQFISYLNFVLDPAHGLPGGCPSWCGSMAAASHDRQREPVFDPAERRGQRGVVVNAVAIGSARSASSPTGAQRQLRRASRLAAVSWIRWLLFNWVQSATSAPLATSAKVTIFGESAGAIWSALSPRRPVLRQAVPQRSSRKQLLLAGRARDGPGHGSVSGCGSERCRLPPPPGCKLDRDAPPDSSGSDRPGERRRSYSIPPVFRRHLIVKDSSGYAWTPRTRPSCSASAVRRACFVDTVDDYGPLSALMVGADCAARRADGFSPPHAVSGEKPFAIGQRAC